MAEQPSTDPFFPEKSPVPQVPEHPRERREPAEAWTVVDRVAGEGARSRLESEERHLGAAGISARIEHDDQGRLVLEVPANREHEALKVIGEKNAQGVGEKPHQGAEERMEAGEKAARTGVFNLVTVGWVLLVVVVALAIWYLGVFK
jgi:hypothetical protein